MNYKVNIYIEGLMSTTLLEAEKKKTITMDDSQLIIEKNPDYYRGVEVYLIEDNTKLPIVFYNGTSTSIFIRYFPKCINYLRVASVNDDVALYISSI